MEQNESHKILIAGVVVSCLASLISVVFVFGLSQKISALNLPAGAQNKPIELEGPKAPPLGMGPVAFAGFAGKLTSNKIASEGVKKSIELRGHTLSDPKTAYESVASEDSAVKKVIIDANTKIYRIVKSNSDPQISKIDFENFAVASEEEEYLAYYEATEGETIDENSAAYTLSIFSRPQKK